MKEGQMLQNQLKKRGECGILEVEKASEIRAWEFPRAHEQHSKCWTKIHHQTKSNILIKSLN